MKRNTLIEHKEVVVICEESGLVSMNYNAPLITLEANARVKHVVLVVTTKSTFTCTNYSKTSHLMEIYNNNKKQVTIVATIIVKFTELVVRTKTQLVKSRNTCLLSLYNLF